MANFKQSPKEKTLYFFFWKKQFKNSVEGSKVK